MPTKPIVRDHSANRAFYEQFGVTTTTRPDTLRLMPTDISGKTHVAFLFFLFSREPDLFRIDDNDKISCIYVWRKKDLFLAPQQVGSFHSDTPKYLVLGVYDPPLARNLSSFCRKGFHFRKRARKVWVRREDVNPGNDRLTTFVV